MTTARALLCSCLTLLACVPAAAQTLQQPTRPERPYRGMFASGVDESGQSLTASGTLSGGYDDNILADATSQSNIRNAQRGKLAQFSGGLSYSLSTERASVHSGLGTSVRYYPSLPHDYYKTYNASVGGQVLVLQKPNISTHASASYRPHSFLALEPQDDFAVDPTLGASSAPEVDFVPVASQYVSYAAGANLNQELTRRVTFSMLYNYMVADRLERDFWRQGAGANLRFQLTRGLGFRVGYQYREAHYEERVTQNHRPDVGFDFSRSLSLTRRTSLSFGVGTEADVAKDNVTRVRATGNAAVQHEMGRTWLLAGNYRRGTYFAETLPEPTFGDGAQVSLGGLITRRLQFNAGVSASLGSVGYNSGRQYDMYRGSMSLSTALTRFMNVGVDYAYYNYTFDEGIVLAPGVPREINRQSIRAHVTLWAPLLNRTRSTNATR